MNSDPSVAKKDLNIIQSKDKIILTPELADAFINILEKDTRFFIDNNIIDYSLLFGIHYIDRESGLSNGTNYPEHFLNNLEEEPSTKDTFKRPFENMKVDRFESDFICQIHSKEGILSADHTKLYFFGIIDILTEFK
jgi:Phosphatidylinositol-4-phosphate 5-kinase